MSMKMDSNRFKKKWHSLLNDNKNFEITITSQIKF